MTDRDTRSLILQRLTASGGELQRHAMTAALRYRADGSSVLMQLLAEGKIKIARGKAGRLGRRSTIFRLVR